MKIKLNLSETYFLKCLLTRLLARKIVSKDVEFFAKDILNKLKK
jgi:hypothetical protein